MEQVYTQIEIKLNEITNAFAKRYYQHNERTSKYCTSELKKEIGDFGMNLGFIVASSGNLDNFHSEWLYDMVWYKENESNKQLEYVELVLESEMAYGIRNIKFDFEKLLLSNANHRIMICVAGKTPIEEIKKYFRSAVDSYSNLNFGSRFLALIWDDTLGEGDFIPYLIIK